MSSFPAIRAGRHASAPTPHAPNAALLIDFDNVTLGVRSDLAKELRTLLDSDIIRGKVAVQRAYADWRRYPQYIVPLSESSIDLIFAPAFGTNKKNATDIRLAVDAIELVFTRPEIGTFILLSGDSDFSSLVLKLKEYGKYVIGVGIRESASDILIQNCDEYYSYNDLAGLTREAEGVGAPRDPWELVGEAVRRMAADNDVMRSDRLKQVMQQLDPNFDERNAGYNRFSKFVIEAGGRGLIKVLKQDNGQFEVSPVDAGAPAPAERAERGGRGRGGRGRTREKVAAPAAEAAPAPTPEPRAAAPAAEGERPGRRRRGGRGRGRGAARAESPVATPAVEGAAPSGGLTLAEAFHLIGRALSELPAPVPGETLRARLAALHGTEDPLLDPSRFGHLLRQANDAEIADVRLVGPDRYEVSPHKADLALQMRSAEPPPSPEAAAARPAPALRFRGGSRGALRPPDIPMVGVIDPDTGATIGIVAPVPAAEPVAAEPVPAMVTNVTADGVSAEPAAREPARGRSRRGRGGRSRAGAGAGAAKAAKAAKAEPAAPKATGGDTAAKAAAPEKKRSRKKRSAPRGG